MSSSSAAGSDLTGRRPAMKNVLLRKKSNLGCCGFRPGIDASATRSDDRHEDATALTGAVADAARDVSAGGMPATEAAAAAAAAESSSLWSSMASTDGRVRLGDSGAGTAASSLLANGPADGEGESEVRPVRCASRVRVHTLVASTRIGTTSVDAPSPAWDPEASSQPRQPRPRAR